MTSRCWWPGEDPLYIAYHDQEWGVPVRNDRLLFEFLCLEGQQAGLSWITVLKKRDHYRRCFKNFDVEKVAKLNDSYIEKLLLDPGLIRNRLKLYSIRINAHAFLGVKKALLTIMMGSMMGALIGLVFIKLTGKDFKYEL